MRKFTLLMLIISFSVFNLFAGGYQVRLQGQKQTGIGLIGTPFAFGASSIFYNPGALTFMKHANCFSAGVSPIFSNAIYQASGSDYKAETNNPTGTPFYAYGAVKILDDLAVGLGVYTPFGSSTTWDPNWDGRFLIRNISLKTIFYQPTVSYQINNWLGIGAGLTIATGNVDLTKALPISGNAEVNINGKTTAFGFNAGAFLKISDKISIGVDYRSKINMQIDNGDAKFTDIPASLQTYFPATNSFNAELPLPANLDGGVSWQVTDKLLLAAELNYVYWSAYDSLIIDFKNNTDQLADSRNPREYANRVIPRIGGQYKFSDKLIVRLGFYYDKTPTNETYFSPETVSLDQLAFTAGISLKPVKGLCIDLSYLQLLGLKADKTYKPENFSGTYKSNAFIPGIGLTYSF